ncbi:MAG: HipA N-terminal domain-containing protein [Deltaproteobacteria bacterium]|nr:HipA N-terminal domain-containing protein [Deltaproteobacteria bacterium]
MAQRGDKADVYLWDRKAGLLERTAQGYRFAYYPEHLSSKDAQPVSLTLPLTDKAYESASLFPFFLGLIPEGWLLDIASRTLKIDPDNAFDMLLATCGDCIGAVKVIPVLEGES